MEQHRIDYTFPSSPACDAGNCGDIAGVSKGNFTTATILLQKKSANLMELDVRVLDAGAGVGAGMRIDTATQGTDSCFEVDGDWSYTFGVVDILSIGQVEINT
jgi:hypothetical protein